MGTTTKRHHNIVDGVVTECYVYAPTDLWARENVKRVKTTRSLWDTGASNTLISKRIVEVLNLIPIGESHISGYNEGVDVMNAYLVHIGLPTGDIITDVIVSEFGTDEYDMVIGMDVICKGDFAITNKNEKTTFSFRIPSEEEIVFS